MSPNETETETEALTRRQRRAITALLGARTLEAAAQAAGVSRKTLSRWMTKPAFRAALLEEVVMTQCTSQNTKGEPCRAPFLAEFGNIR
jgi:transposase